MSIVDSPFREPALEHEEEYTAWEALKDTFAGRATYVTTEQREARLKQCDTPCPFLKSGLFHKLRSCKSCGCLVEVKAIYRDSSCPKGFWKKLPCP